MKPITKQQYSSYIGLFGLACLLASAVAWVIQMKFGTLAAVFGILGLLGVLAFMLIDLKRIQAYLSKRSVKYGANVTVMILVVLGIVVLVEIISSRHDFQLDLTKNKRFTLSDQTQKILHGLEVEIKALAFFDLDKGKPQGLEDLLQQYTRISSKMSYEFVDPDKNPGRTKQYNIPVGQAGVLFLETGEKRERLTEFTEETLTNALIKVTREGKKVVYVLTGHGEPSIEKDFSNVKNALTGENYEVKELLLMQQAAVPEDAAAVLLGGPKKDLLPAEADALKTYVKKGGGVLLMLDPEQAPGMMPLLKEYGVVLGDNMIIDTSLMGQMAGTGYGTPLASKYYEHPITEKFTYATAFPGARSVKLEEKLPDGITGQLLVSSGQESWAETSKEEVQSGKVKFDQGSDVAGPISLAAALTIEATPQAADPNAASAETPKASGRLVVFGDSDFASNAYWGWTGNSDLFLNTVNWLAQEEDLVAIRAKAPDLVPLVANAAQINALFWRAVVIPPIVVIIVGIVIFINRKKALQ